MKKLKVFYKNNKQAFILSVISLLTFLLLIVGATFAYFTPAFRNNTEDTNVVNNSGEKISIIAQGSANIYMDLTLADMKRQATNISYYASSDGTASTNPNEVMATFINESNTTAYCDYTVEVSRTPFNGKTDMLSSLQEFGQLQEIMMFLRDKAGILNTVDFKNASWTIENKLIFTGRIEDVVQGENDLYIDFMVNNFSTINQGDYLANTGINLSAKITSITCYGDTKTTPRFEVISDYDNETVTVNLLPSTSVASSYCINELKNSTVDCTWTPITTSSFTESINKGTIYYLHIKDTNNNIGHSRAFSLRAPAPVVVVEPTTFQYKNEAQTYSVSENGTYRIELWGAGNVTEINKHDGGGYTSGNITLTKGDELYFYVGAQKNPFNGGGTALGSSPGGPQYGNGATDVRIVNETWNNNASLISRIMVAGAAGINADLINGDPNGICSIITTGISSGGGLTASNSVSHGNCSSSSYNQTPAYGGSQTAGGVRAITNFASTSAGADGSFGIGGSGGPCVDSYYTCSRGTTPSGYAGGGGYYGGGGCWGPYPGQDGCSGSAGGSSYISGHTGCVAVTSTTSSTPKSGCATGNSNIECSKHPNGYVFINGSTKMIDGAGYAWTNIKGVQEQIPMPDGSYYPLGVGHTGNGVAKISYVSN